VAAEETTPGAVEGSPRSRVPALVRALRPHQWTKNLFVFAPVLFEHKLGLLAERNLRVVATFAIFCCLASGIYLLNDVIDREADRLHPRKRLRPVAAGEISPATALGLSALLIAGGLLWAHFGIYSWPLTAVCAAYVVIQTSYTLGLKRVVLLDVMCIASGFVLRLIAGGSAAWVTKSSWILVCTIFVSLFLALCKRRHEVVSLGEGASAHRSILAEYPPALLDQLIGAATAATLVSYTLYTVDARTVEAHGLVRNGEPVPALLLTVPFVIYGIFRYLYLVYGRREGGSPTSTLLRDVPSLANGLLYLATVLTVFRIFRA
jgi:4-hydroxybenzoate polyprenyltransferase